MAVGQLNCYLKCSAQRFSPHSWDWVSEPSDSLITSPSVSSRGPVVLISYEFSRQLQTLPFPYNSRGNFTCFEPTNPSGICPSPRMWDPRGHFCEHTGARFNLEMSTVSEVYLAWYPPAECRVSSTCSHYSLRTWAFLSAMVLASKAPTRNGIRDYRLESVV